MSFFADHDNHVGAVFHQACRAVTHHIFPDMGGSEGLLTCALAQLTAVHLRQRARCASAGGASASTGGADWALLSCGCTVLAQRYSKQMRRNRVL